MLEAAATARGTLGPLLTREPYRPAGDGDPTAFNWKREQAEASAVIDKARTDPDTARRILAMFTAPCRTLDSFNRERDYFIRIGIPAGLLPSARELGRADLA